MRALDGVTEIQRGPAFHCQLAGSSQRRPLGPYTNLASLLSRMHRDWPSLNPMHGFHAGTTTAPYHPLSCAPWCSLHSGEWTRARSSSSLLPQLWVNIFARTVLVAVCGPLSCSRNTLPSVIGGAVVALSTSILRRLPRPVPVSVGFWFASFRPRGFRLAPTKPPSSPCTSKAPLTTDVGHGGTHRGSRGSLTGVSEGPGGHQAHPNF